MTIPSEPNEPWDDASDPAAPLLPADGLEPRFLALPDLAARQLDRLHELDPGLDRRLAEAARRSLRENRSTRSRLRLAAQLAYDVARQVEPLAACRRGCAHCCHLRVEMTQLEAEQLGEAIGRRPNTRHRYRPAQLEAYGLDTPCPFLEGRDCSIYAHRPLACRKHHNLDIDALFCRLDLPVHYRHGFAQVRMDAVMLVWGTAMTPGMGVADIRDWFPGPRELEHGPVGHIATAQEFANRAALRENLRQAAGR